MINSILFLSIFSISPYALGYIVQKNETLSYIAEKYIPPRVYAKYGGLTKILKLNPKLSRDYKVQTGEYINLGENEPKRSIASESTPELASPISAPLPPANNEALHFELNPYYSSINIAATDSTTKKNANLVSKYYVGLKTSYVQNWSESFQTSMHFKLALVSFEKPVSTTKTIQNSNKFISSFGMETNQNISRDLHLKFDAHYGKELFLRGLTTQVITIDAINIPTFGTSISYDLKKQGPYTIGISTSYAIKFPAQTEIYNVKLGREYGASLYFSQIVNKVKNSSIQTELGFTQRKQDTTISSQTETNINFSIRYSF